MGVGENTTRVHYFALQLEIQGKKSEMIIKLISHSSVNGGGLTFMPKGLPLKSDIMIKTEEF